MQPDTAVDATETYSIIKEEWVRIRIREFSDAVQVAIHESIDLLGLNPRRQGCARTPAGTLYYPLKMDNFPTHALIYHVRDDTKKVIVTGIEPARFLGLRVDIPTLEEENQKSRESRTKDKPTDLLQGKKDELIDELCKLPITQTYAGRTSLLHGIPNYDSLNRIENNRRLDLDRIVTQLAELGRTTDDELLLVKLIDNALPFVEGLAVQTKLENFK